MAEKKVIVCGSCGATFDEKLAACPYCDTTNIKGAETQYLDKLEDVREDLADLTDVPMTEVKKEVKKQTKFIIVTIGTILGILLLLVGISLFMKHKDGTRDLQADYIWQQENFPILEELYAQENYEEMVAFYGKAYEEDRPVNKWEHAGFCAAMELFLDIEDTLAREQAGETLSQYDYEDLLYVGFRVENYEDSTFYSQEEKERMAPYIARVRADFEARWSFTEEELEAFAKEAEKNYGYISYDVIQDYIEDWMERNK